MSSIESHLSNKTKQEWKHCSYRQSDFLLVDYTFYVFYRVTPFQQAQIKSFFNPIKYIWYFYHTLFTLLYIFKYTFLSFNVQFFNLQVFVVYVWVNVMLGAALTLFTVVIVGGVALTRDWAKNDYFVSAKYATIANNTVRWNFFML